jgi:hypothetical protein
MEPNFEEGLNGSREGSTSLKTQEDEPSPTKRIKQKKKSYIYGSVNEDHRYTMT